MNRKTGLGIIVAALVLIASITPPDASASTILLYEGQAYSSVQNDPAMRASYTQAMCVTGWLEIADPLAANTTYTFTQNRGRFDGDVVLGYSMHDGLITHGHGSGHMVLTTDSNGALVSWSIYTFDEGVGFNPIGYGMDDVTLWLSSTNGDIGNDICDNCIRPEYDHQVANRFQSGAPGHWTVVPEPASLTLLIIGTAACFARARRNRGPRE